MESIFVEISLSIIVATIFAIIARALRLPLILAYILAGVMVGPVGLNLISLPDLLHGLSAFGVAFLLFLIGLELDIKRLREIGKTSTLLGAGQILLTGLCSFFVLKLAGVPNLPTLYATIALTFSSTIIVVKLLSEQKAQASLFGRLSIGVLLVQDFVAILVLIVLAGIGDANSTNEVVGTQLIYTLAKGSMLFVFTALMSRYVLPHIFAFLARSDELLFLASISWAFFFSLFAAAIGFSIEIGAFLAGIALASVPYNLEIAGRVRNLRDFFITIFFVALGTQLTTGAITDHLGLFFVLTIFVLIAKPLLVIMLMGFFGYHRRTGFLVGSTLPQISEFSFILMALGAQLGHVPQEYVSLITAIGVVTIALSSFLFTNAERLYGHLAPALKVFQRENIIEQIDLPKMPSNHIILVGVHRTGRAILESLKKLRMPVVVVDFDPQIVKTLTAEGIPTVYGELSDFELLERLNIKDARMIITTVPDIQDNLRLLQNLRRLGLSVPAYVTGFTPLDALELYEAGATYVILPHHITGKHIAILLETVIDREKSISTQRAEHIAELREKYSIVINGTHA